MLVECAECKTKISSEATACPSCGRPQFAQTTLASSPKVRAPAFLIAAVVGLAFSLYTPKLILVLPILATVVLAIISIVRRERARAGAAVVLVLAIGLFVVGSSDLQPGHDVSSAAQSAQITDWNWQPDPTFGTNGTIKWNVSVKNISDKPISMARVEFSTYDAAGKLITTTFTYVHAIPPGETRSDNSYADLYGNEAKANVQLTEVNFAN
jgi:hypothetical protein